MSLYRCAACGSPNVVTDTEKEGYSYAKGAVGTVLLGVGGAAAGINGKTKTVYKCPDCGTALSYSMPFEIKTLIDMGVMSEKMRNNLQLNGAKIDWITLTSRYKNIESSSFVVNNTQPIAETNVAPQVADKKVESAIPEETKNANRSKYEVAKREHKKAHEKWEDACLEITEKRETLVSEELVAYEDKIKRGIEQNIKESDSKFKKAKAEIESKIKQAEMDLAGLGFFKFKEKKQLKNDLLYLEGRKSILSDDHQKEKTGLKTQLSKISELSKSRRTQVQKEAEKKLPFPKLPDLPKELFVYNEAGEDIGAGGLVYHSFALDIREFLLKKGWSTIPEIKKGCPILEDMTEKRIAIVMDILVSIGEVGMSEFGDRKYGINYNKWGAEDRRKAPSYREEYKDILELMKSLGGTISISDICENIPQYKGKSQRASACLRHLMSASLVERFESEGKAYFRLSE